jgi:hypothetical protein
MKMGQEHGKEHLFEHVDALLVSGTGFRKLLSLVFAMIFRSQNNPLLL